MYSQSITRMHRTAILLLIDQSGSMLNEIPFRGAMRPKAEVVATIANELIFELIERARRTEGMRNYYDLAVIGYGGDNEVKSLLDANQPLLSVSELEARPTPILRELIDVRHPDGTIGQRLIATPRWVTPRAAGHTPMWEALRMARELTEAWVQRPENSDSFPPMIFNITDGEATDCSDQELMELSKQIRSIATCDGEVLLLNIHLTSTPTEQGICFPSEEERLHENHYAELLYEASSMMPSIFDEAIRAIKGRGAKAPFRGMSFNASAHEVMTMLNIGSISVKTA